MTVREATVADLDLVVSRLARRREHLVPHAPIFWSRAPDADERHRAYLGHLLGEAGARCYLDDEGVLVAAPRGDGWLVDDLAAPWSAEGLWASFAADASGDPVRMVCPVYDDVAVAVARAAGLVLVETWWLRELPGSGGGRAGARVALPGTEAVTVAAPPVYAPPGPVLLLAGSAVSEQAVRAAVPAALDHGCAAVVVSRTSSGPDLGPVFEAEGFRPHCEFHEGLVRTA